MNVVSKEKLNGALARIKAAYDDIKRTDYSFQVKQSQEYVLSVLLIESAILELLERRANMSKKHKDELK